MTMTSSRHAAQSLALFATRRVLAPTPPSIHHCRALPWPSSQHPRSLHGPQSTPSARRQNSSVPAAAPARDAVGAVRDRAARSAAAFDAAHDLSASDTLFSSWRGRQRTATARRPVRPHRRAPLAPVPRGPDRPPAFFPPYARTGRVPPPSIPLDRVLIHDAASVARMRTAARVARRLLDHACHPAVARVGRTTETVDDAVRAMALAAGAYPSPLNYRGFPKNVCSSVNEVVCHGIPDGRPLEAGDVVAFDVSCYVGGVHGDNCATIVVGDHEDGAAEEGAAADAPLKTTFASPEEEERFVTARRLVRAALESRDAGVAACGPGGCLSDVGGAIHAVADAYGYDTVRHYRGHGIGSDFHCAPFVKHFRNDDRLELLPGMIFTIEPMITEGSAECVEWSDEWTVVTEDGGRAAQFEHTVLITEDGVDVLTQP